MPTVRLAELLGSLALATEPAAGVASETTARAAVLAVELARDVRLTVAQQHDAFYATLLRYIGCTSFAHETSWFGLGDDIGFLATLNPADSANVPDVLSRVVRASRGASAATRAKGLARVLTEPALSARIAAAHCHQAVELSKRLDFAPGVTDVLAQIYERFDGKGGPRRLKGEQIDPVAAVVHVALRAELHRGLEGPAAALEVVKARSGKELNPALCEAFLARGSERLARVDVPSASDLLLESEPAPARTLEIARIADVALAFAHYVDVKSPFTLGHSTSVARICEDALREAGAPVADRESARLAGLVHDLGRAAVPNGIWDKPGALTAFERARVEQHTLLGERVLTTTPVLAPVARIVGAHHERLDGSGYHRGAASTGIPRIARFLAASDVYIALREDRAYRSAHDDKNAARILADEARAGRLDREAVEAVLSAAGVRAPRLRGEPPAGLSDREAEVLCLVARGLSNKEIGKKLFISPRTVGHHIAHVYEKTGVRTRAAAALFAVEHGLVEK